MSHVHKPALSGDKVVKHSSSPNREEFKKDNVGERRNERVRAWTTGASVLPISDFFQAPFGLLLSRAWVTVLTACHLRARLCRDACFSHQCYDTA